VKLWTSPSPPDEHIRVSHLETILGTHSESLFQMGVVLMFGGEGNPTSLPYDRNKTKSLISQYRVPLVHMVGGPSGTLEKSKSTGIHET
jgi:hypothetical protein